MKTKRYRYAPAEYHFTAIVIIIGTLLLFLLCCGIGEHDVTGIILFPCLFIGVILRCAADWIHAFFAVAVYASKHILTKRGEN